MKKDYIVQKGNVKKITISKKVIRYLRVPQGVVEQPMTVSQKQIKQKFAKNVFLLTRHRDFQRVSSSKNTTAPGLL